MNKRDKYEDDVICMIVYHDLIDEYFVDIIREQLNILIQNEVDSFLLSQRCNSIFNHIFSLLTIQNNNENNENENENNELLDDFNDKSDNYDIHKIEQKQIKNEDNYELTFNTICHESLRQVEEEEILEYLSKEVIIEMGYNIVHSSIEDLQVFKIIHYMYNRIEYT